MRSFGCCSQIKTAEKNPTDDFGAKGGLASGVPTDTSVPRLPKALGFGARRMRRAGIVCLMNLEAFTENRTVKVFCEYNSVSRMQSTKPIHAPEDEPVTIYIY